MYVLYLRMILFSLYLAPYLTLPCLTPLQTFPVLPLLFLCSDLGPQCMSIHTHYTLHSTLHTLHCFAWPHSNLFDFFHCFSYVLTLAPNVKDRPDLTLHSLHSSPPTFTLQTPVLNLTPIFSSYSSSSIAFLLF